MVKFWTVAFRETAMDYNNVDVIGLFASKNKAISFAETYANDWFENRKTTWSPIVRIDETANRHDVVHFKTRSGCDKVDFVVSQQEYYSDADIKEKN